jgi:hypothetical protein
MEILGEMALVAGGEEQTAQNRRTAGMGVVLRVTAVLARALMRLNDDEDAAEEEGAPSLRSEPLLPGRSQSSVMAWLFPLLLFAGREQLLDDAREAPPSEARAAPAHSDAPPLTALRFLAWLLLPVRRRPLHEHLCTSLGIYAAVHTPRAVLLGEQRTRRLGRGAAQPSDHDDGADVQFVGRSRRSEGGGGGAEGGDDEGEVQFAGSSWQAGTADQARAAAEAQRATDHHMAQRAMVADTPTRAVTLASHVPHDPTLFVSYDVCVMLRPPDFF